MRRRSCLEPPRHSAPTTTGSSLLFKSQSCCCASHPCLSVVRTPLSPPHKRNTRARAQQCSITHTHTHTPHSRISFPLTLPRMPLCCSAAPSSKKKHARAHTPHSRISFPLPLSPSHPPTPCQAKMSEFLTANGSARASANVWQREARARAHTHHTPVSLPLSTSQSHACLSVVRLPSLPS